MMFLLKIRGGCQAKDSSINVCIKLTHQWHAALMGCVCVCVCVLISGVSGV